MIVCGDIRPGEIVREQQLAGELGFGRTPVREALQRLAVERVVTILPRRGIVVAKLGIPEILETFEAREVVEAELAALAATRHSTDDAARLTELSRNLDEAALDNDFLSFLAVDQEFHRAIASAAKNRFLERAADHLLVMSDWFWHQFVQRYGTAERPYLHHDVIVTALLARDSQQASDAMAEHIRASRAVLKERF